MVGSFFQDADNPGTAQDCLLADLAIWTVDRLVSVGASVLPGFA
jgi:hypothetical protein